ncbi:MAG TPA: bifunctional DNA-binding transcriptional regulator/O6-methylguanine-DNA methyltransferase Ada [Bryobacteraceae bacterium]|nr:bifunctional DNA-binding transcriptional regulator/O6-methylguanine-DNA methyltransferase Ada [Bryobacteraceae bacterium]
MPHSDEKSFWEANFWDAVLHRDARMDGFFYYAVRTSGVYCRPSCGARRPRRENVLFFRDRQDAERAGFRACLRCRPASPKAANPQAELARRVCRYIENNLEANVTLDALSREFSLSPFHLQRTFKSVVGITPRGYADACRLEALKRGLRRGNSVTRAMVDAGYSSSSRLYERAASQLGMGPSEYRKGGAGTRIRYGIVESPLGNLLVAATQRGICAIRFGESEAELEAGLRDEFSSAIIERDDGAVAAWTSQLTEHLAGRRERIDLPLDIRATAFQRLVWEHLRSIPRGATESYSEVAAAIGRPTAVRAVARACATNPVALAIPCHRVVREDGSDSGYRWGAERKRRILEAERQHLPQ